VRVPPSSEASARDYLSGPVEPSRTLRIEDSGLIINSLKLTEKCLL
jgi:hypothetical protein